MEHKIEMHKQHALEGFRRFVSQQPYNMGDTIIFTRNGAEQGRGRVILVGPEPRATVWKWHIGVELLNN